MNNDVLTIALAGFLHNIGIFVQCTSEDSNANLFNDSDKAKYKNDYSLYTAYFIKNILKEIPETDIQKLIDLSTENNTGCDEKEKFIINIAKIISAGMDTNNYNNEINKQFTKVRLQSIFNEFNENIKYEHSLSDFNENSIFPQEKSNNIFTYSTLSKNFFKDLENLQKTNLKDWFIEFDKLNKKWISFVPSNIQYISLYDHLRTTSAITQALYVYHKDKNDFTKN